MTLAEFQPHVERAVTAVEWALGRAHWRVALEEEYRAVVHAYAHADEWGLDPVPLHARIDQISIELGGDVTADRVPQLPLRSVPMDLIAEAVARRILKVPAEFPILGIKALPTDADIEAAVMSIAQRWQSPNSQSGGETTRIVAHV
jgi:hypothetical protein